VGYSDRSRPTRTQIGSFITLRLDDSGTRSRSRRLASSKRMRARSNLSHVSARLAARLELFNQLGQRGNSLT
jgi:hypothetical protein